jgi:hypothetical protein
MKLTALQVFNLFNKASDFQYEVTKLTCGGYQLDVTVGYTITYSSYTITYNNRNVLDNISLVVDGNGEVDDGEYYWFQDKMDEKLQEKEAQRVKEARRKELLDSMSKEDKELLGLN